MIGKAAAPPGRLVGTLAALTGAVRLGSTGPSLSSGDTGGPGYRALTEGDARPRAPGGPALCRPATLHPRGGMMAWCVAPLQTRPAREGQEGLEPLREDLEANLPTNGYTPPVGL